MMKDRSRRARIATMLMAMLITGVVISLVGAAPASAHVSGSPTHLWSKHIKKLAAKLFYTKKQANTRYYTKSQANGRFARKSTLSTTGTINASTNPVAWTKLMGVPTGLADGADANSGGDITGITAGLGLDGGGGSGSPTIKADIDEVTSRYCALAAANPFSFPVASCSSTTLRRTLDSAGTVGSFTSIAIGTDGYPVVSYYDASNLDLKVVHCSATDCSTKDTPQTLDSVGDVGRYTSIAIGTDGFPVVSYYAETGGDLKFVHCTAADCSTRDAPQTLDNGGVAFVGYFTSIAIGTDGNPIVSYRQIDSQNLMTVHCTATDCSTRDAPLTLDSAGNLGDHTSIAIGTDGYPVMSYTDATNGNLKLVHCTSASCSTRDLPRILHDSGVEYVGTYTSLTIGADGYPVVSYQDATNGELKTVHCTSVGCATKGAPQTLDSTAGVGYFTSLAIGTDGNPIVSYRDDPNGNLKSVHCTAADCSIKDAPRILDSAGDVGRYTSIAIGTDGYPVVSYQDSSNGDLKISQVK